MMKTTKILLVSAVCASMMLAGCSKNGEDPLTYTITVASAGNGTASPDKTTAEEGATVTLTAYPADGYVLKQWSCEDVKFMPDATTAKVSFTMPAKNVIVSVEFELVVYTVTVASEDNGIAEADKTSATKGETVTLTATADPGCEFVKWNVESGGAELSSPTAATATFTMPADNVSIKAEFSKGILINGVVWAPCNVDAPGTFTANPEDFGMYYQWNRKTGWSSTDPLTSSPAGATWNSTNDAGERWTAANDPCPAGWRVPTNDEQIALCDDKKTTAASVILNDVNGYRFTDDDSKNSIFLPAAGFRFNTNGALTAPGEYGYYWSTSPDDGSTSYGLIFDSGVTPTSSNKRAFGFAVRCVSE